MSQTQIQLVDVKQWLSEDTRTLIEPLHGKAHSLVEEIRERVDDAIESSRKILQNSQSEMDKGNPKTHRFARNANKFAESLINTLNALKIPDSTQHESVRVLCDDLEKTCASVDQLRRSAYPYISPYFIFDRRRLDVFIKRLYDVSKETRSFLDSKYATVKTLDDAYSQVDRLVQTLKEIKQNDENLRKAEEKALSLEKEITEAKEKLLLLRTRSEFNELSRLSQRIDELRTQVKHNLRYLQKPFYKLQSLARSGEVAIPPDEIHKLEEYLKDPLTALVTEDDGYLTLKSVLKKLDSTMAQGRLKLKATRLRKAQDQTNAVLIKDSLDQLQKSGKEALTQKRRLLSSETTRTLQSELKQLEEQLGTLQKEYELAAAHAKALKNNQAKLKERTEHLKKELEGKISQLTRKNVQLVLTA